MSLDIIKADWNNGGMNTNNTHPTAAPPEPAAAPSLAAGMLSAGLGESEGVWTMRLANWRRPGRTSPLPWHETPAGKPGYDFADVQAYIDRIQAERAATTPPRADRDTLKVTAVPDVEADAPFVRVMWNAGTAQGAFNVSPAAAKQLAAKLIQAVARTEQIKAERVL